MPKHWHAGRAVTGEATRDEIEDQTALRFEQVLMWERFSLGPRQKRDGGGDLSVDFTFDHARPPIALEITRLLDDGLHEVNSFLIRMGDCLTALAREENLGFWHVAAKEGGRTRRSAPPSHDS